MLQEVLDRIQQGDCIEQMKILPDGCVDLAFADPPFNIGYEYDVYDDAQEHRDYLDWSRRWIEGVHRVLKPTGTFWLAIGDEYAAELKLLSQEIGFHCRSWVIWYYTFGVNCTHKFSRSHAHLFYFVKNPTEFTFRRKDLQNRVPSARQLVYADARANPSGRLPDDTWILRPQDLADCFTPDEDTWYFPRVAGTFKERAGFHGCQMPEQLLGRIIRTCSHENEVVLDPFSGSATTLVVAKKLGRRFFGFELSDEYVQRGTARLEEVRRGDLLEGAPEPLVSAPTTPIAANANGKRKPSSKSGTTSKRPPTPVLSELIEELDTRKRDLITVFRDVSDGFSLDRVIADPALNSQLADACRKLGLPGDTRTWNRMLLGLRKARMLAGIPTQKRTEISWKDCDSYLFASEIALSQLLAQGFESLDEILCDPSLASKFDELARSLAPGFTELQYRWGALKLRKAAKYAKDTSSFLSLSRMCKPMPLREMEWRRVPDKAGIYLVIGNKEKHDLYGGETFSLRERLHKQFVSRQLKRWETNWSAECVAYAVLSEPRPRELIAYQRCLVSKHRPMLNLLELAVA